MQLRQSQSLPEKTIIPVHIENNTISEEQLFLMQILNNEIELFDNDEVMDELSKMLNIKCD